MGKSKILIIDDEPEQREVLEAIFAGEGYRVDSVGTGQEALARLESGNYDLILSDLIMPAMDGIALLKEVQKRHGEIPLIIITGYGSVETAVKAMRQGAYAYFIKSHDPEELLIEVEKALKVARLQQENEILRDAEGRNSFALGTRNPAFSRVLAMAGKAARSNVNILLLGESGVGKEVMARYIHNRSDRSEGHLMAVNCHAFSEHLLESELFGHEKGAFTGADQRRKGRFEAAHGGTLFLDEIGDIPHGTQVKLLRGLESRKIERIGSNKVIDVDFRLIAATNKDLAAESEKGNFRSDLYYRISSLPLVIPPLRERKEDLPELIDFFFNLSQVELKKKIAGIESGVRKFLKQYHYPGNIRELKNIVERLVVLSENGVVRLQDLPDTPSRKAAPATPECIESLKDVRRRAEADHIRHSLSLCRYNMAETARRLKLSRRQLFNKINEYGLK